MRVNLSITAPGGSTTVCKMDAATIPLLNIAPPSKSAFTVSLSQMAVFTDPGQRALTDAIGAFFYREGFGESHETEFTNAIDSAPKNLLKTDDS